MQATVPWTDLIARWDGRVPRYTSYPTAVSFHPGIDADTVGSWLARLDPGAPVSLYLHVPFCKRMCWYCGCNTMVANTMAPVEAYARDLIAEAELLAARLPARMRVTRIHWGGGTPSILGPTHWGRVDAAIRRLFDLAPDAEIAVELDPRTLTRPMIAALAASGVTRTSLGVQDFNPEVQKSVNRVQPLAMVADAIARLRGARIEAINLDLMYGLPHQDEFSVALTAREALKFAPDRVALFGYAHVPWMKRNMRMIDDATLPDAAARLAQFHAASRVFDTAGYAAIGLDHFAKPDDPLSRAQEAGTLRRNFQGYTDDAAPVLLGLGASAITALPDGYAQNEAGIPAWRNAVTAGRLAIARGTALDDEDRLRAALIERVMCDLAVDVGAVCRAWKVPASRFAGILPQVDAMAADGLVVREGWRIAVLPRGRAFLRTVAALFDHRLDSRQDSGARRHARAV
ncbi:oxygen-independent coproporphyrinogen III oxidase [Elioraea sp.]|uniref:oxygen-independent coproporphyrinogen III oxidase n=1 Tax=Elioraea sp. TaxID=2185103 RepID=UPI0025B7F81F|nr:oxygen-independent coproporphyrinogen III oxidase [Elioraea sp.]